MARRRTLATITDAAQFRRAIADRRRALGLSQAALDDRTGLCNSYQSKLEAGMKGFGALSLGLVLQALGVKLLLVADPDPAPPAAPAKRTHVSDQPAAPPQPDAAKPSLAQVAPAPVPVVMRPRLDNTRQKRSRPPMWLEPGDATA